MLGLYVHIPFCKKICNYCDFPKRIPSNKEMVNIYLKRLKEEYFLYNKYFNDIDTIYIGGGTPNYLDDSQLDYLFNIFSNLKNIKEYTIELNSELLTLNQVKLFNKYNINRISIGVQTFNNSLLKLLNRDHDFHKVEESINLLKKNNINNINLDFIFAIPNQTLSDLKNDLHLIEKLNVNHISYYNLILEDKTVFKYWLDNNIIKLHDDETEEKYFKFVINELKKMGFNHYEISNFCKDNTKSIHNLKYWTNKEYIGIGLGASGYLNNIRYTNQKYVNKYLENYKLEEEYIDIDMQAKEELIMGLRLIDGINLEAFKSKYNKSLDNYNLTKFLNNLLEITSDNYLKFTSKGLFLGNIVFEEII